MPRRGTGMPSAPCSTVCADGVGVPDQWRAQAWGRRAPAGPPKTEAERWRRPALILNLRIASATRPL